MIREAVFAESGGLMVKSVAMPCLGSREVLVRIRATALNRADLLQARGMYPPPTGASDILGLEMAGEIVEISADCSLGYSVGDRVMALMSSDGYSNFAAVDERMLMRIPDSYSFLQAAAIPEVWLTAFQLLFLVGDLKPGMTVLIHAGASGVGIAATQLAVNFGSKVLVTASSAEKIRQCVEFGASAGFNYKEGAFAAGVMAATQGVGVDMVPCL
jgi:tumor protein p53-inducible protein 3